MSSIMHGGLHCSVGWCYIRVVPDSKGRVDHTTTVVAEVLGYELWFYGTFASLAVIYITLLCYIKFTVSTCTTFIALVTTSFFE